MKVAIHQPNFFPYPGFFKKLFLADKLVLLDKVQFEFGITNRNKIISSDGSWVRITVPVKDGQKFIPINQVEINNDISWEQKNLETLLSSYENSPYFHLYAKYLKNIFTKNWDMLFEINFETLKQTITWLNLDIEIIKESELNIKGNSTERLVNICKSLGATDYISGIGGKNYLSDELFAKNNVTLHYHDYIPITYPQHNSKSFLPNMSILDLLANMGPESQKLLEDYS